MMADATLRPGDAYASADGLRVFVGSAKSAHRSEDFVPVTQAQSVSAGLRARLVAASAQDQRRAEAAREKSASRGMQDTPTLVVHASAPRAERTTLDAEGRRIRFVGGAAPQQ
jgi:hypothetical protein